jgi:hypothetical protein
MISRRHLLVTTALVAPALATACSATSPPYTAWAQDIADIAAAISSYASSVPSSISSQVATLANKLSAIAESIISTPPNVNAMGLVSDFQTFFTRLLTTVGGTSALSSLGTFGQILQQGLTLLPVILSLAGVALAPSYDPKAVSAARAYIHAMAHS